ncbi:MAG TPA: hypothetical protein VKN99_04790 [Polyangia bacterium]|nr:hypothetical protein [Polyangia bacterium]
MRWFLIVVAAGCTGSSAGGIPKGTRVVTGALQAPSPADLGSTRPSPAFQLVGVHNLSTIEFGEPFDPNTQSGGDTSIPFRLALPCERGVSLHFQAIANSSANELGPVLGLIEFQFNADAPTLTTLFPRQTDCVGPAGGREIRLGTVRIDFTTHRVIVGGDAGGTNPLTLIDTDGDGIANFDDPDDDGDGIPDVMDPDEDGDGVPDAMEGLPP